MKRNIDLALLRTLLCVSETGSMSGAAQRLYLTQGAVSQQIKRLEQMLDQRLLERSKGGVRLSEAGHRLVSEGRELIRLHDELFASFTVAAVIGTVRLGVPHDLMATHLPPLLHTFVSGYPRVNIALSAGSSVELRRQYDNGELDLVILEELRGNSGGRMLALDTPVWVGRPGGNALARRPLPVSLLAPECIFRPVLQSVLGAIGCDWYTVIDYPSIEATAATVNADEAVTVLLASTVPPYLQILDAASGLPELPQFAISLHGPALADNAAANALASVIIDGYRQSVLK